MPRRPLVALSGYPEIASTDTELLQFEVKEEVAWALLQLPKRQRAILELRFGLRGERLTLELTGKRLRLSHETIRQLEQRALSELRGILER